MKIGTTLLILLVVLLALVAIQIALNEAKIDGINRTIVNYVTGAIIGGYAGIKIANLWGLK